jgi:hypothetical protein
MMRMHTVPVVVLIALLAGCSSDSDARDYARGADAVCEQGRARLRADPDERNSTKVLISMQTRLRALGTPPDELDRIGPDVPAALAQVTWAAEFFQKGGRLEMDGATMTVGDLRALGFHICGTQ